MSVFAHFRGKKAVLHIGARRTDATSILHDSRNRPGTTLVAAVPTPARGVLRAPLVPIDEKAAKDSTVCLV